MNAATSSIFVAPKQLERHRNVVNDKAEDRIDFLDHRGIESEDTECVSATLWPRLLKLLLKHDGPAGRKSSADGISSFFKGTFLCFAVLKYQIQMDDTDPEPWKHNSRRETVQKLEHGCLLLQFPALR